MFESSAEKQARPLVGTHAPCVLIRHKTIPPKNELKNRAIKKESSPAASSLYSFSVLASPEDPTAFI